MLNVIIMIRFIIYLKGNNLIFCFIFFGIFGFNIYKCFEMYVKNEICRKVIFIKIVYVN